MKQLDVYLNGRLIGYLRQNSVGLLCFAYDKAWLTDDNARPFAPEFPLEEQEYHGEQVVAYFDNLLPEGGIREFIARAEHISAENVFGLLERFGGDTAGALSVLPHGQNDAGQSDYFPVTATAIREWFSASQGIPLNIGERVRMSLSGAQVKIAVYIDNTGNMKIPLGSAPSSHIIKPSMDYRSPITQLAVNKVLIMNLAKAAQFEVPQVWYDPQLDAAVISRYDRQVGEDERLYRLHQNDICQLVGISSRLKYESEGGPSLKECIEAVMRYGSRPAMDKKRMIEWVIFNLVVGNMDSHAKNISLLASPKGIRLAPFYDLICTTVYPELSKRFAFKVGGENRPAWIMERHWERFAAEIEAKSRLVQRIKADVTERITVALPAATSQLREVVSYSEGLTMIDRIEVEVQRLLAYAYKGFCLMI